MNKVFYVLKNLLFVLILSLFFTQEAFAKKIIRFWHHTSPPADNFILEKAAAYMSENPDIEIKFETEAHGDYEVKLLAAIAGGNEPDIMNLLDYLIPKYAKKGILAPLNPKAFGVNTLDEVKAMYTPAALEGLTLDGQVYATPEEFNTLALFINGDHMRDIGLNPDDPTNHPKTWNDLFDLGQKLGEGAPNRVGFNWVWLLDPYWYAQQYWPILVQYGCEVFDSSGNAAINSGACVKAFTETWRAPIDRGLGGPEIASGNKVNALDDFSNGNNSMAIAGIWAPPSFSEAVSKVYVAVPLPQLDPENPKTLHNSYALGVSARSEVQDEAYAFIRYLTSDSDGYLKNAGYVTGFKDWEKTDVAKTVKGSQVFATGQLYGSFVWRSETWTEEGNSIKAGLEEIAQGVPVYKVLNKVNAELNKIRGN